MNDEKREGEMPTGAMKAAPPTKTTTAMRAKHPLKTMDIEDPGAAFMATANIPIPELLGLIPQTDIAKARMISKGDVKMNDEKREGEMPTGAMKAAPPTKMTTAKRPLKTMDSEDSGAAFMATANIPIPELLGSIRQTDIAKEAAPRGKMPGEEKLSRTSQSGKMPGE